MHLQGLDAFLAEHSLPASYGEMAAQYFLPLLDWLNERIVNKQAYCLGINGGQGTGKSTMAAYVAMAGQELHGWKVVVLSLDDFYLTQAERQAAALSIHPLFATRGVPGTHDTALLLSTLQALTRLDLGQSQVVPSFDKYTDDRRPDPWPVIAGPVDLIVLEGWCVGSVAQASSDLLEPVNSLEREQDADRVWRTMVNENLSKEYARIFDLLDALVFLKAPSFDAIFRWRLEQEAKLAKARGAGDKSLKSAAAVREFISYFERLTRHNFATLGGRADVVFSLGEDHIIESCTYQ